MKADIDRVTKLLTDTVMLLCKNGLTYDRELKIQGLLAVTLDSADVFVVQISETFESPAAGQSNEKSLPNADKSSADKQTSRKRVTPTTSRPCDEIVDLTRLAETPLSEPPLGHSRNTNFHRHSMPPLANNAPTMMRPPVPAGTSSLQSSRGHGFPIGSCWPLGANQYLDVSGLNRFPNALPPQNFGLAGVRDGAFADSNNLHMPQNYWTNARQPNPGGFHCPLPVNKPSRDLSVPTAARWQYNANYTMPHGVANNQLRVTGSRHTSQRSLEKLSYATDAVPSFTGTANDGNFRVPVCTPRHRQPLHATTVAPTQLLAERHTSAQVERLRDAGFSQFVVSCPAQDLSRIGGNATAGAGDGSSFGGVMSSAGRSSAPRTGSVVAPVVKPCLSPVPVSSNNDPLDLSDGVHSSARNTGSTSAPLPCTEPSGQPTNSFQSTSGSVERICELVNQISESVNHSSRSVDRDSSPVLPVSESATDGSVSLDRVCIPANRISQSADDVSESISHDSNLPCDSPETIPAYAIVTIIPDDIDDDFDGQYSFPLNKEEDLPDVKMPPITSDENGCNMPETGTVTQEEITEVLRQEVTQGSADNLMPELSQEITHENMPQAMDQEASTGLQISNEVQEPANHALFLDSCPVSTDEVAETGNAQVSDLIQEDAQPLETDIPTQKDIMEDLPVLTKVIPTETIDRTLAAGPDVLATSSSVNSSGSLKQMPILQNSENWSSHLEEEQDEQETLIEETSLANPCSLVFTTVADTKGSAEHVDCAVDSTQGTFNCPAGRSYSVEITRELGLTETGQTSGALNHEIVNSGLDHQSEAENLTSSDNSTGVIKQPLMMEDTASNHTSVLTNLSPTTASFHPPQVMDNPMIKSNCPSKALLCPSKSSDPPSMELINPSDVSPSTTTTVFSCKSKGCRLTYDIASDLAFHYIYQHPELIAGDLLSGNCKSRKCSSTSNAYAKSLRASTASKREYSEQTRGLRDPSLLVRPCATTMGKFVLHRPKKFPCPKAGCTKNYSCEKRLSNHLQIFHRKHPDNFRQLNSSNLRSSGETDSSADNSLGVDSSMRLDDGNFLCPKAGCAKKYTSEKRLANHFWICHREHPADLGQKMDSSDLRSDDEMDSSVAAADNLGEKNSDDSEPSCHRDSDRATMGEQSSSEKNKVMEKDIQAF